MVQGASRRNGAVAPVTSPRPLSRPPQLGTQGGGQTTGITTPSDQSRDTNQTGRFLAHGSAVTAVSFPDSGGPVTKETLMGAIEADNGPGGLASKLTGKSGAANRAKFEKIAETCVKVGQKEGVDPRILFAMAMQESDCGLNTRHNSSAQGITGMKPTSAPDRSARTKLADTEVCLTQTARYLKGQLVRELKAKGHDVSAADVAPGANNAGTAKLLLAYRYGAGALNGKLKAMTAAEKKANPGLKTAPPALQAEKLNKLVTNGDYSAVFRHMRDMGRS
ncbi:MAG: hypothetical protein AB7I41_10215 [Candidatus Sericytochromatia bacterium]